MEYPSIKICLDTSVDNLIDELYTPCLKWAERFDRGVGYFTSGWIEYNLCGLSDFASRGGRMRLITSPILSNEDIDMIIAASSDNHEAYDKFKNALLKNVDTLKDEMRDDIKNAFAWMINDGIIDLKFAIPCCKLEDGDFHDKFGVFYRGVDALSFSGSINDSKHGFSNYESIKVFTSWNGTADYVNLDKERFEKLWNKMDSNIKIFDLPAAVKERIFEIRTGSRPYSRPSSNIVNNKWEHQDKAVEIFLEKEHGILAMATGTGKTRTAIKIINKLFESSKIKRVIISMYGNDLLDQWAKQMREEFSSLSLFYHYGDKKMMKNFIMQPDNSILIVSRDSGNLSKLFMTLKACGNHYNDSLLIFDEVHGAGSSSMVENLTGMISPFRFRLGLSATPEREYDEKGNEFLINEIGEVIFTFSLKDAIEKGILCSFNYIPLSYVLTEQEKAKKKNIIAAFNAKKKNGEPYNENDMFTQLANVNKTAIKKLDAFRLLISEKPELLEKCIIFVHTMEYGKKLQEILINFNDKYHTYYADDEKEELEKFASGEIECIVTCQKISEGIDIRSVTNIILFASDRSRLVTTQRIGRALRIDDANPNKIANVVDFVIASGNEEQGTINADEERKNWLKELSKIRRLKNEK